MRLSEPCRQMVASIALSNRVVTAKHVNAVLPDAVRTTPRLLGCDDCWAHAGLRGISVEGRTCGGRTNGRGARKRGCRRRNTAERFRTGSTSRGSSVRQRRVSALSYPGLSLWRGRGGSHPPRAASWTSPLAPAGRGDLAGRGPRRRDREGRPASDARPGRPHGRMRARKTVERARFS